MATTATTSVEDRKRLVRALVGRSRGFAEEYGLQVTNNPASLFQVLCLSILLRRSPDVRGAVQPVLALRNQGWGSPARMARSRLQARAGVLRDHGRRGDADRLAATLGSLAGVLVERYQGDLRRLRAAARYAPARERTLLRELPGVDVEVVELFLREVQALWSETPPVADRGALIAARKLSLGRTAADLAVLAGGGGSEKLAWLVGALARVELENTYDEIAR
ncbi:hypothetical protein I0C86_23670 [Plantactinospora sp. S1510]|uniref:Endonuclease n=1 Tax=Plantactinospora alkalitolerans TaxID=2789879 RepID=A0ABS0H0S2_9ACTN|nr:hypothetical protein [Plantactinospora alkalitolerans]MBF9131939.1 hypothetical protein [Plantactinospora alkalitolerans]